MPSLSIGQVAKQSGVSVETIRFYERKGLLEEPPRKASGYRLYSGESIKQLAFIRQAKVLGFSLTQISELLSLQMDPSKDCGHIQGLAREKLQEVEQKIESLSRIKEALQTLIEQCPGEGPMDNCPILDALNINQDTDNNNV